MVTAEQGTAQRSNIGRTPWQRQARLSNIAKARAARRSG